MSTFLELQTVVTNNLNRVGGPAFESTAIKKWINQACNDELSQAHSWAFMRARYTANTIANQEFYSAPNVAQFKDILLLGLRIDANSEYTIVDEDSDGQLFHSYSVVNKAKPRAWALIGDGAFALRPIPDVSTYGLLIVTYEYPGDLVNDADTNWLTLHQAQVLEMTATARGLDYMHEWEAADRMRSKAKAELAEAIEKDKALQAASLWTLGISLSAGRPAQGKHRRRIYSPATTAGSAYNWYP